MNKYRADLGQWESGRTVEYEATDDKHALLLAEEKLDPSDDSTVVQIKKHGSSGWICIYDYMNGFYKEWS